MTSIPTLAIGADAAWRSRIESLCAAHRSVEWLGAFAPGEARATARVAASLLLVDGDDAASRRRRRRPARPTDRLLIFYRRPDVDCLLRSIRARAHGCLPKGASAAVLRQAVRCAAAGLFVAEHVAMGPARRTGGCDARATSQAMPLTPRQRQIADLASIGMSNKEIARALGLSPETVKSHLHHAFRDWHVTGRMGLLAAMANTAVRADMRT